MTRRARLSSSDRAWCQNRKITTRAVPVPVPPTACRRSSTATHRDFAGALGSVLVGLAGEVDVSQRWEALSIDRKRAVIDAVFVITVHPGKRGGRGGTRFDPASVTVARRTRI